MKLIGVAVMVMVSTVFCWSQTINKAEYFFDSDPGPGNGVNLPITTSVAISQTYNISTASLSTGFHTVNTRVRSNTGMWSLFASRTFFIIPAAIAITPSTLITKAEYFIDNDPGIGNGTPVSFTAGSSVTFLLNVPTNTLSPGFHTVNVRALDNQKRWSLFGQRTFYIVPPVNSIVSSTIVKAEYFFNTDPGVGNATALPITSASSQNNTFTIDVSSLSPGFHQLGIRYQDNLGSWSHFSNRTFYIVNSNLLSSSVIRRLEYFIDANPQLDASLNGTGVPITSSADIDENFFIDLGPIAPGSHVLYVRAQDDKGFWSTVQRADFTILNCTTPAPPSAPAVARCGEGTVALSASGATTSQVYRWYESNTSSTILSTGQTFTTPALSATRAYFVSIYDPATSCESSRTEVTASINFAQKPGISPSGSVTFCQGGSVILSAPSGFSQYVWSTGETTREVLINTAGQYSVRVGDGSCVSPSSDPVDVTVVSGPAKPVVAVNGNTVICETGTVVLTGPSGFNYLWSTGATTRSISVSQTGVYTLQVSTSGGCLSTPSDAIGIVVQTQPCGVTQCTPPAPPIASAVTRCGEGPVTLSASGATGTQVYRWYNFSSDINAVFEGSEFITPSLSSTRDYFVSISDPAGSCESARSSVSAIVRLASKPLVTPDGNLSICEGSSMLLSAPPGFSQYVWSTGETTRQISVDASGTYSVQVGDGTCVSPASDVVTVTEINAPEKPITSANGSTTICGSGSVVLSAPAGFEYTWSNGESTQSITVTQSGVYFVRVKSTSNCESAPSDPISVIFQSEPCGNVVNNQPPVIDQTPVSTPIEGVISLDLTTIVSDQDGNLDYTSLRLLNSTTSRGATASIDASYNLIVDYSGLPFTGVDRVTIEVCDLAGACVQQVLDIEVAGAVVVYNGVTPDGDGKNDFLLLKYIDVVEAAKQNRVTVFNRWGDVVFDTNDYDNTTRVFAGTDNNGRELPSGTYFYKIEFNGALKSLTGFLTLKR
jgi:gliding motility-associated-like protein